MAGGGDCEGAGGGVSECYHPALDFRTGCCLICGNPVTIKAIAERAATAIYLHATPATPATLAGFVERAIREAENAPAA